MHGEKRTIWYKEGLIAAFTGIIFGGSNTLIGLPFDTIKTKMQAEAGHMAGVNSKGPSYIQSILKLYKSQGILGFYKGCMPTFLGSIIYRSAQFSSYEMVYTKSNDYKYLLEEVPGTGGIQKRIILGGLVSGTVRSLLECPFEYAKVKRQTNQQWHFKEIYKGFSTLYPRSTCVMLTFFITVDSFKRHTNMWDYQLGKFIISGGGATLGFWILWPFEVLKNLAQADNKLAGSNNTERIKFIMRTQGIKGFYRGILPGSQSIFARNGGAMLVMQYFNKKVTQYGWRD